MYSEMHKSRLHSLHFLSPNILFPLPQTIHLVFASIFSFQKPPTMHNNGLHLLAMKALQSELGIVILTFQMRKLGFRELLEVTKTYTCTNKQ